MDRLRRLCNDHVDIGLDEFRGECLQSLRLSFRKSFLNLISLPSDQPISRSDCVNAAMQRCASRSRSEVPSNMPMR